MTKWQFRFTGQDLSKKLSECFAMGLFVVAGLTFLSPGITPAAAATDYPPLKVPKLQVPDTNQSLLLKSDNLAYDKETGVATATGNVEIYFDKYTVLADRVTYSPNRDVMTASGNVVMTEPDGNVIYAESVRLSDKFREGNVQTLYTVFTNQARLAAASATREEGNTTVFSKVVYSACKACEENKGKPLLWQIKADKVVHDKKEKTISYENAKLEFFGVPVLYVPKFTHPDPTVKRKSGFLTPSYTFSDQFGSGIRVPYFWNIAPNMDVTFSPTITTKQGLLADVEFRQRLTNGKYSIRPIGIYQLNPTNISPGDKRFRGALFSDGEFNINENWKWGWDVELTSDDTFLRRYNIRDDNALVSEAYLTGLKGRNYFDLRSYYFQGLRTTDNADTTPYILPALEYNYTLDRPVLGGEVEIDTSFFNVERDTGADSTRLSTTVSWRKTIKTPSGVVVTPFAQGRGDLYRTNNVATAGGDSDVFARILPVGGVDIRMPWVKSTNSGLHIIEPIAQVIVRPNETKTSRIPNEDSQSFEFGTTNLFSIDKFSGVDRFEGGTRANVGLSYTYSDNISDVWLRAVVGQSYQLGGRNSFGPNTGLENGSSDYVGELYIQPTSGILMSARVRLDDEDFSVKRNELAVSGTFDRLSGSVSYTRLAAAPAFGELAASEVINASARVRLNKEWTAFGSIYYDIRNGFRLQDSIGLHYEDECLILSLAYRESFTEDRDIEPEKSLFLQITLKTIGGTGFGGGL